MWEDFHARVIPLIAEMLMPHVRPRYVVRVEERVYFEQPAADRDDFHEIYLSVRERETEELVTTTLSSDGEAALPIATRARVAIGRPASASL